VTRTSSHGAPLKYGAPLSLLGPSMSARGTDVMSRDGRVTGVARPDADSRWPALVVLCAGMLMIVLDQTIVNVALPSIQSDLGFTQAGLAWVVNAYLIAFGGLLLLAGRLGDLLGRKRIFLIGLTVFTGASLLCGVSVNQGMLVAARFLQGVGGAMTSAVILGLIVTMFPEPRERAKAIGVYSFVASAGASLGLLLGGVLTQGINWHWIFFVNLPIAITVVLVAVRLIRPDRGVGIGDGADVLGALLVTAALMLGVYTIVGTIEHGWASMHTLGLGGVAIGLTAAFVVREARAVDPLLPLRMFRSRNVTGANAIATLMVAGMFGMFFLGALYLQRVLGYGALGVGLAFLPAALVIGTLSLGFSARLTVRFGARAVLLPGLTLIAVGLALLTRVPVDGRYVEDLLPAMVVMGVGAGLSFPSLMTLAMSGATPSDSGLASGLVNTTLQVGGALGLAVLATLSASRTATLLAEGGRTASALTGGYHMAFAIGAGLVVVAILVAVAVLRPEPATAQGSATAQESAAAQEPAAAQGPAWEQNVVDPDLARTEGELA
jgi:EmrB/QacA subfamily drug resistance transporter